jgi:hypothetical protein
MALIDRTGVYAGVQDHSAAFPRVSYGSRSAITPATRKSAPLTKIGTLVVMFAYSAIMGAWTDASAHDSSTTRNTREDGRP